MFDETDFKLPVEASSNRLELVDEERKIYKFNHSQPLPVDLPSGYCFIGGVARNILLAELGEHTLPPRDLDIVAIEDLNPDTSQIDVLSAEHMADDYVHGHGIKVERLRDYFEGRDFTINEIFVHGNEVYATEEAIRDLKNKVIRPTEFETERWSDSNGEEYGVHPKLVMKALRIQTEFEEQYGNGQIEGIEKWQWDLENVPLFYIALALDKAYQRGDALATKFYTALLRNGTISPSGIIYPGGASTRELALNIRYHMHEEGQDPFDFKRDILNQDVEEEDSTYTKYAEIANTYLRRSKHREEDSY